MNRGLKSLLRSRKSHAGDVLLSERYVAQLALLAARIDRPLEEVARIAREGLEEIATMQHPLFTAMFDYGLGPMHTRAWTIEPDLVSLQRLRKLNKTQALVFLPTHRSYADAFILTRTLRENGLPRNHILGGNNLGFFPLGTIIRRAGGVLVRRSFQDDEIYKFVVREYLGYLVSQGRNLEWYMEGGRSRTGKLRPPKYGLLRYLVDAIRSGVAQDMLLVPTSITYDQLHEIAMMAAEEAGAAKPKEGLRWLAGYARMQQRWIGTAFVRFGEPLSLRDALDRADAEIDGARWTVEKIAFEVFQRINRVTPVTAPALVTLALLGVRDRALTLAEVGDVVAPLLDYAEARRLPLAQVSVLDDTAHLEQVLDALAESGVVLRYARGVETVYGINPGQHSVAAYYRNSAVHWFINRAVLEIALLAVDDAGDDPLPRAWDRAFALRDLLKFDFFFSDRQTFREEIKAESRLLDPDFRARAGARDSRRAMLRSAPFLVAHRVLTAFVEAYFVVAERLEALPVGDAFDKDAFVEQCLHVGKQYLLQRRLRNPEAISRELFGNGLQLAKNRDLLGVATTAAAQRELSQRRLAFAEELEQAVRAVAAIEDFEQHRFEDRE